MRPMTAAVRSVLESVRAAREGRIDKRNPPFAEHMCRIPLEHMPALERQFPGLDGKSGTIAHDLAMREFHASPVSEPYRVNRRVMGTKPRGIIIRPPAPTPAKDDRND